MEKILGHREPYNGIGVIRMGVLLRLGLPLNSIRLETRDPSPTLSLIRLVIELVIDAKTLRRTFIEAETGRSPKSSIRMDGV